MVYGKNPAAANDPNMNLFDYDELDPYELDGDGNIYEKDGIIGQLMVFHSGVGEEAGGGKLAAYRYTIEPEDGATGVLAHEFGHDLGLPDEYDTIYSGQGEAVSSWPIMANGSWAGKVPGTEPTSFSPYAKQFFQATIGGNWLKGTTVEYKDITKNGTYAILDQSTTKGKNDGAVRINLPDKVKTVNNPASGRAEYFY